MDLEENHEPPKKKLKQAQLVFSTPILSTSKTKRSSNLNERKQSHKDDCENDVVVLDDSDVIEIMEDDQASEEKNAGKTDQNTKNSSSSGKDINETNSETKLETELKASNFQKCIENYENLDESNNEIVTDEESFKEDNDPTCDNSLNKSKGLSSEDEKGVENTTPPSSSAKKRKLTLRSVERQKLKGTVKQEKLNQKERDKEAKLKIKLEKEELKRKEKEEKEEQKRKEKEEREKKKLVELKQKEEEKRLKEEERRKKEEAKEEEKRLKEEERRKKEEAKEEEKKKKEEAKLLEQKKEEQAKKAFTNFFILKKSKNENVELPVTNKQPQFMPFQVKPDMRLATIHRRIISDEDKEKVDEYLNNSIADVQLYLKDLKNGKHLPMKGEPTWPFSEEEHDIIIVESAVDGELENRMTETENKSKRKETRAKLLQFHDNRRPAYWGTWRKKSESTSARKPFSKDKCLNYEVDSDSEWEEEGEGEDIGDEDSDKEVSDEENSEEKDENGYILDNTFVPHGYLSDEEVQPDEENYDPEDQKLRLKVLKREFEEEKKMKTERLKPRLLGCVWISNDTTAVSKGSLYEILMNYRGVWEEDKGSIEVFGPTVEESPLPKSRQLHPKVMEQLVKFVHGNTLPFFVMVQEFRNLMESENISILSKRSVSMKIKEIARRENIENGKQLWTVNADLCNEYGLTTEISQMTNSSMDKSKETMLDNFLKRPSISPQHQKTIPTTSKNETCEANPTPLQPPGTPALPPIKKRATLITLPQTPNSTNNKNKVHKDTPRPVHPFFKNKHAKEQSDEKLKNESNVIDLCDD